MARAWISLVFLLPGCGDSSGRPTVTDGVTTATAGTANTSESGDDPSATSAGETTSTGDSESSSDTSTTTTSDPTTTGPGTTDCQPLTCAELTAECGEFDDTCGNTLNCGDCAEPQLCNAGQCAAPFADTERQQLNYLVVAHPDDEISGWSLIEKSPGNYAVFIHMTRGDATGFCAPFGGYQPDVGEAPPGNTDDYEAQACAELRIGSALAFYAGAAEIDGFLGPIGEVGYTLNFDELPEGTPGFDCPVSSTEARIYPGKNAAIIFFDMGDGDLTQCETEWAISQTRRLPQMGWLPQLPEYSLIATGYYNMVEGINCRVYAHPDHRVIHEALWETDFGTPGPQWGRTCREDPDAKPGGTPFARVEVTEDYDQIMELGPGDFYRIGPAQVYYGWLMPDYWELGEDDTDEISFNKTQAFWGVH